MPPPDMPSNDNPKTGIALIMFAMVCITINDMLVKQLSYGYPLHQMVFIRSAIGLPIMLVVLQFEGGFRMLRTRHIGLHLLRGLCIVGANMAFFAALAELPLADTTALFFVAPLFITLLSIPLLGEKVGPRRLAAVVVGFLGVLVILRPGAGADAEAPNRLMFLLPVAAALGYAMMQILTRRLRVSAPASVMAVYIQFAFIATSIAFLLVAGDGRLAEGVESKSGQFLLRAWAWPTPADWPLFIALGVLAAVVGYTLSQAYRTANAATLAPFEYTAMPLAIMWGWTIFGERPDVWLYVGSTLIVGAGIYVFLREKARGRVLAARRPTRRG